MEAKDFQRLFSDEVLKGIFPPTRSAQFFEALYGDVSEGAYTIGLTFQTFDSANKTLFFNLELHELPGKCLVCNLTYGLPEVFSRHPIINIKGVVREIETLLGNRAKCRDWRLGRTQPVSNKIHTIPLMIRID